jgi:hypothetical protein
MNWEEIISLSEKELTELVAELDGINEEEVEFWYPTLKLLREAARDHFNPSKPRAEHKQVKIRLGSRAAEVDEGIADLILALWEAGIGTIMSCQENYPGVAWIELFEEVDFISEDEVEANGNVTVGFSVRFPAADIPEMLRCVREHNAQKKSDSSLFKKFKKIAGLA